MTLRYEHILAYVAESVWAILPSKLTQIMAALATKAAGEDIDPAEIEAIAAGRRSDPPKAGAGVAVLPLWGVIGHRAGTFREASGGTSTERFGAVLSQAVSDPAVSSIVLDVDSPGGAVSGVPELADQIARAKRQKPIVAVANSLAASAAYWLGSQADEMVVTPSGQLGSIGVMSAHTDLSKALAMRGIHVTYLTSARFKAEGAPEQPLSAEATAHFQTEIDHYHNLFVRAVARGRGVAVATVRGEQFGEGRVYNATEAVKRGMADRVATLDQVVGELASGQWSRPVRGPGAEDEALDIVAEPPAPMVASSAEWRRRRLRLVVSQ